MKLLEKFIRVVPALLLTLIIMPASAQEESSIPAGITVAFKAGNAAELAKYMNATVELLLLDKEDFYKKNVAETILRDFFNNYHTKDFVIRHQGAKNEAHYAIGSLKTDKGDFRVYFLLKRVDSDLLIHLIRIEPDNGK